MTQYGFYYDATRCTGCKTCVLACKDYKDLDETVSFRNVIEYGGGTWNDNGDGTWSTDTYAYFVSVACNHCDNPACVAACPASSMVKEEDTGIVHNDPTTCIGCGSCVEACPYGAPKVDATLGVSVKCDMCMSRVLEGKQPICVEACSTRALEFGPIEELRAAHGEESVYELAPLPSADVTGPNLLIKPPANAKEVGDGTGSIINTIDIVLG